MLKEDYMKMALELAKKAEGYTSPNPMVGCVVVKDGKILTTGYHERYGEFHAERNALTRYEGDVTGADMYVTLEPCCHHGKTPPCTDIIIEKGIKRVFVGSVDSNPKVGGKGIQILREHGIEVETGILKEECDKLNEVFFHNMEKNMPFVAMKYAMTLDGKIACESGDSKWITGETSRAYVQQLRKRYKGIMAGIGTVIADDPMLNVRIENEDVPHVRIICDTNLRINPDSKIVRTACEIDTIVACGQKTFKNQKNVDKLNALEAAGVQVMEVPENENGSIDLKELMKQLYDLKIDGILLEGGGTLNASMLRDGLVSKVYAFVAPKLIGGADAKSPIEGTGIQFMRDAVNLNNMTVDYFDRDILITGYTEK